MPSTFEQFVAKYTESFHNNRLSNDLIDNLKKQYEMYKSEETAGIILYKRYDKLIRRKQLMPNDFGEIYVNNVGKVIEQNDFTFTMYINTLFAKIIPKQNTYVIEGICTSRIVGIHINHVSFYIADELIINIPGYQIKEMYYFESPITIQEDDMLKIRVNMSSACPNFPIMFLGYKFYVNKE